MNRILSQIVRRLTACAIELWNLCRACLGAHINQQAPPPQPQANTSRLLAAGGVASEEFSGSTEEALILMQLPPVAKVKRRIIVPISQQGEIPELVEEIKLTRHGKTISRTEFLVMDGNNSVGRPELVKGLCRHCGRFSFQGGNCEICGHFCCPACQTPYEEASVVHRLCPACGKQAQWSRNTWK